MMRLAEPRDAEALASFCGTSLAGCYILSRFAAYANRYPFAACYVDAADGEVVTALSVLEHSGVLLTSARTDFEELSLALPLLSVRTVMTNSAAAGRLPFPLLPTRQAFCCLKAATDAPAADDAPLRDVYDLISSAIPDSFPAGREAYLHFLSDFTFRQNRGLARLKAVVCGDRVCACALTAAECAASAVISGVACAEDCRGRGYGKRVVSALSAALQEENKTVHVIARNEGAEGFYRRIGFQPTETVAWMNIQ